MGLFISSILQYFFGSWHIICFCLLAEVLLSLQPHLPVDLITLELPMRHSSSLIAAYDHFVMILSTNTAHLDPLWVYLVWLCHVFLCFLLGRPLSRLLFNYLHPLSEADEVSRGVMAAGHCHSQWMWWSDTLWHSEGYDPTWLLLLCLFWLDWNWHNSYLLSVNYGVFFAVAQICRYCFPLQVGFVWSWNWTSWLARLNILDVSKWK
jgi:hypothetical protein